MLLTGCHRYQSCFCRNRWKNSQSIFGAEFWSFPRVQQLSGYQSQPYKSTGWNKMYETSYPAKYRAPLDGALDKPLAQLPTSQPWGTLQKTWGLVQSTGESLRSCPEQAEGCFCSPSKLTCPPPWPQPVEKGAEGVVYLGLHEQRETAQHLCMLRTNVYPMGLSSEPQSPAGWSHCWAERETAWRLASVRNSK